MVSNTPVEVRKVKYSGSERLLSLYRMPGIIQLTTAITTQWGFTRYSSVFMFHCILGAAESPGLGILGLGTRGLGLVNLL